LHGESTLLAWLSAPAELEAIRERQTAVAELSYQIELRQELEASVDHPSGRRKVSGGRFAEFSACPALISTDVLLLSSLLPWLSLAGLTWVLYAAGPTWLALAPLAAQILLVLKLWAPIGRKLALLDARRRDIEALSKLLGVLESAQVRSPLLRRLRSALDTAGQPPSRQLRRLRFWVGLADARMQPLVHPFLNALLLWDIHVIAGIERWNRRTGQYVARWLDVIGQAEALA
jgi:plasmid stabilization system protein ParE